uniref:Cadherin domain-containing protein n=1 Tax=Labrus bergylta TaxID=56723 RepID=A0A3Q3E7J4_9LABR
MALGRLFLCLVTMCFFADKGSPPQFSSAKLVHVTSTQFKVGPPVFERAVYRVNLSEFAPLHTPVTMVTNKFTINPDTGLISTTGPINADSASRFELDVITSDKKAATKVIVDVIDVNNNGPEFEQTSYKASVDENNTPVGTEIIQVDSTDKDQGRNGVVRYSILGGTNHFAINEETGVVTVTKPLDRELHPIYVLKIASRDQAVNEPQLLLCVCDCFCGRAWVSDL